MPPAYDIAAKLPTYEEAEMTKHSDSRVSVIHLIIISISVNEAMSRLGNMLHKFYTMLSLCNIRF